MAVKEYKSPIQGTVVCHWCGYTNHSVRKDMRFYRIDGIMGCASCWNIVKETTNFIGITDNKTMMKDLLKKIKQYKKKHAGMIKKELKSRCKCEDYCVLANDGEECPEGNTHFCINCELGFNAKKPKEEKVKCPLCNITIVYNDDISSDLDMGFNCLKNPD